MTSYPRIHGFDVITISTRSAGIKRLFLACCFGMLVAFATPSQAFRGPFVQLGIDIDGEVSGDESGIRASLSADGSVIAIGATLNDDNGSNSGHTRVYFRNGNSWVQRGHDIDGESTSDHSGLGLSLNANGTLLAIGSTWNDFGAGHTRVFAWDGISWVQRGDSIEGEVSYGESGRAVSLSADGNVVAIGTPLNDAFESMPGYTRIYDWSGSSWIQRGLDINGEADGDASGASVSLSADGNIVAIGAWGNDDNGIGSGHTRIYTWNGNVWVQRGLDIDGESADDRSGGSVSISADGSMVAIGASRHGSGLDPVGHTRIFAWSGVSWIQRGQDIDGKAIGEFSGNSVSLSTDGSVVAIGARGIGPGLTRVYTWSGSSWIQRGLDIHGEADGDASGASVSLSADGSLVAIGAPGNDGNGTNSGHVRVFAFDPEAGKLNPAIIILLLQQQRQQYLLMSD